MEHNELMERLKKSIHDDSLLFGLGHIDNSVGGQLDFFKWSILYFIGKSIPIRSGIEDEHYFKCEASRLMKFIFEQSNDNREEDVSLKTKCVGMSGIGFSETDTTDSVLLAMQSYIDSDIDNSNTLSVVKKMSFEKYRKVKNLLYKRKIHESYHFASPFLFLFWVISAAEKSPPFMDATVLKVISKFQKDAYQHINELYTYEIALLVMSTLDTVEDILLKEAVTELIKRFKDKIGCWDPEPVYFNNILNEKYPLQDGYYAQSRLFVQAICFRCLHDFGEFGDIRKRLKLVKNEPTEYFKKLIWFTKLQSSPDGVVTLRMTLNCMEPTLSEGDTIYIDTKQLAAEGQIIAFRYHNDRILAHQVLEVLTSSGEDVWITTALNGGLWGYPVFREDYLGRVIYTKKEGELIVSV